MNTILKVENLYFSYGHEWVIEGANLSMERGDFGALIGSNGAGKTTLIKLLLGILKPNKGTISLEGKERKAGIDYSNVSYVPQLMAGVEHFPITVEELIGLSLYRELKGWKRLNDSQKKRIHDSLKLVGLEDKEKELYQNLSGGQRQRVLIAKALVSLPEILIMDEPTTGIDAKTRKNLFHLLSHLNQDHNITILMITHDLHAVEAILNRVFVLDEGKIYERSPERGNLSI
ncbi:metal ABC transporter ATP-binding protein [Peptoniphilus sp. KCTC 25270]|uniref:metal ABC transporter ATP-binding protein n=1 Tax=Peptoniphilus sp. KCTC 25270 TaxID=2897414 RepID=UPI001E43346F|nr:metal ABC transporter ATP-binding protein [Peptoniphilus sp. KCTC 25270]MCD1147455.1 metal ABC transporter ATP-binding protein [Peptoniphilus sp. KCTC 25270]